MAVKFYAMLYCSLERKRNNGIGEGLRESIRNRSPRSPEGENLWKLCCIGCSVFNWCKRANLFKLHHSLNTAMNISWRSNKRFYALTRSSQKSLNYSEFLSPPPVRSRFILLFIFFHTLPEVGLLIKNCFALVAKKHFIIKVSPEESRESFSFVTKTDANQHI